MHRTMSLVVAAGFLAAIVLANYLTDRYGLVSIGLGLSATAGTFTAGATFTLRDQAQDALGRYGVLALIALGVGLSVLLASPGLAVASGCAFACSELADLAVYTPLRPRSWWAAVLVSGVVAAVVDTAVFLPIAFGWASVTAQVVTGQLVAKIAAMAVVALVIAAGDTAPTPAPGA